MTHPHKIKPKIIQDYYYGCGIFTVVSHYGNMLRGICKICLGRLLQSFHLPSETTQRRRRLFK